MKNCRDDHSDRKKTIHRALKKEKDSHEIKTYTKKAIIEVREAIWL